MCERFWTLPNDISNYRLDVLFGVKTLDGLGMLVSQGARSFEIVTGKRAPFRVMKNAVEQALKFRK